MNYIFEKWIESDEANEERLVIVSHKSIWIHVGNVNTESIMERLYSFDYSQNEDLIAVAYDRITLYSTEFAAFIKSPLSISRGGG